MTSHNRQTGNTPGDEVEGDVRAVVERIIEGALGEESLPAVTGGAEQPAADLEADSAVGASADCIAIGADHGGYPLKERLAFRLRETGYRVDDCGTDSTDSVDYPDFAHAVARRVADGSCRFGIIIDGAGIGSSMVANKVPGIRAALCHDLSTARNSREHNHANVLALGGRLIGDDLAWQIVEEWLAIPWGGGRHARRVDKINDIELTYARSGA